MEKAVFPNTESTAAKTLVPASFYALLIPGHAAVTRGSTLQRKVPRARGAAKEVVEISWLSSTGTGLAADSKIRFAPRKLWSRL